MLKSEQIFINEQANFFHYLVENKAFQSRQTYSDYLTRLRYASQYCVLDGSFDEEKLEKVYYYLLATQQERDRYNTPKTINDIKSGLRKFLLYVKSNYAGQVEQDIRFQEDAVSKDTKINATEREAIIRSRVGQGLFRQKLIDFWQGCSVTECKMVSLLVASHIKPWRDSSNSQRLDVYNGLLLTPNLDKLFDRGYISFEDDGKVICSKSLPEQAKTILLPSDQIRLTHLEDQHREYLDYHRQHCLLA